MTPRKSICYRLNEDPCKTGWLQQDCDAALEGVYTAPVGGVLVVGARVVPCADCPREVFGSVTLANNSQEPLVPTAVETCVGTTTIGVSDHAPVRMVQPEGTVFRVKLCQEPKDHEVVVLCAPTGNRVVVQYDVLTTPPTVLSAWDITTNTAYTAPFSTLTTCDLDDDQIETVPLVGCLNGRPIAGYAVVSDSSQNVLSELWRNPDTNTWGPLPAGATASECQPQTVTATPVWWTQSTGVCAEGNAWYDNKTGALVKVTDVYGAVVPTPAGMRGGQCQPKCAAAVAVGLTNGGI